MSIFQNSFVLYIQNWPYVLGLSVTGIQFICLHHYQEPSNEILYEFLSQGTWEIPEVKVLAFQIDLIKQIFFGIFDFDF